MAESGAVEADTYFLSYSRSDEAFALRLAKDIRSQGVSMWVDQIDIRPSEHWDRAIERAVRDCRGLVVILSPRSVASDNVADEISFAIEHGKSVLPVMIERCRLPLRITRMQVIDATGNYQRALDQCVVELRRGGSADRQEPAAAPSGPAVDAETAGAAKRRLTGILGPIASVLVDKATARAKSAQELYQLLSLHIEDGPERTTFLASMAPAPTSEMPIEAVAAVPSIPAADIDALSTVLARYLGPIASVLTRRESSRCRSMEELKQRLVESIRTEGERAQFLREVQSLES